MNVSVHLDKIHDNPDGVIHSLKLHFLGVFAREALIYSAIVIPAEAGIQKINNMDSRFRGNDG
jgi:hypothetical protein